MRLNHNMGVNHQQIELAQTPSDSIYPASLCSQSAEAAADEYSNN